MDLSDDLAVDLIQLGGKPHWTERTGYVPKIDWVICGGMSDQGGVRARPMHPLWPVSLRDQCAAAAVPFHFKQWGSWAPHKVEPGGDLGADVRNGRVEIVQLGGEDMMEVARITGGRNTLPGARYMRHVPIKDAGRLLAGIEHDGFVRQ